MKRIKVLSYNIHVLNYGKNKEQIVDVIKAIDPDIVGLQEIDMYADRSIVHGPGNQIKWLAEQLGYPYYHFSKTCDQRPDAPHRHTGEYGHGVLSKFPIKETEVKFFDFQNYEPRNYTRHILDFDGEEIVFYNTHLCCGTWEQTGTEMIEWVERAYQETLPTIMTADLNVKVPEQIIRLDTEKLFPLNGGRDWSNLFEGCNPERSWDNIYCSNHFEPVLENGHYMQIMNTDASDHRPVWGTLILK